ncbi:MAG: translation factor GTPase family protein [Bacteroidota bacterium]
MDVSKNSMIQNIRNIAILAAADAGKTTLTENFLFKAGSIKKPGSVNNGTTQTDSLNVEKERGISVRSANTSFEWENVQINLIDTPGHVDFSADVERILRAIDAAILVVSAVEGIQAHTETLWMALKANKIPCILFINKIDRMGANTEKLLHEIHKEFTPNTIILQQPINAGENNAYIQTCWNAYLENEKITEAIASTDDDLLEKYINGEKICFEEANQSLAKAVHQCKLYPVLMGSAKNGIGIEELLTAVNLYFPRPEGKAENELSALVYRIEYDQTIGKISHVRIFEGSIANRAFVNNASRNLKEKVTRIRKQIKGKYEDVAQANAGDVVGISGFNEAQTGDVLGKFTEFISPGISLRTPLLTVQLKAINDKDYAALAAALQELCTEDPSLDFQWLKEEKELHVKIMGWIQIEVLERIIEDRFQIKAKFENPTVIYKETPSATAEGYVRYWMPKPCWAIMKFSIAPGVSGSGVQYISKLGVNDVLQKYQNEVERTIPIALQQGIKGWEVTDIKITLIEGEDHAMHTHPGDFVVATPMGIMDGLVNSGTTLLEPMLSFRISATEDLLGAITSDITQMRGNFESPDMENGKFLLSGILPLATSLDYPVKLSSRSGGKAKISTQFHSYRECTDEQGVIRAFKGISPLDTAKYILKARKALQ